MDVQIQKLKVAVVGCGYWGQHLVRNFSDLGVLCAVVDYDESRAKIFAKNYKVVARKWDEVLTDTNIDAVSIATPAATHGALVVQALEHRKHVLVEKPMALDIKGAETIVALAKHSDRILMVGHLLQYHPAFLSLRDLSGKHCLGKLRYIYSNRLNFGKFRSEENILWSFAPHDISMILSLTGCSPLHVTAVGQSYLGPGIADSTITHLSFESNLQAHVYVSWLHPFKEQKLVVIGDKAMAVFDDTQQWDRKLLLYPHSVEKGDGPPVAKKETSIALPLQPLEPLRQECLHFLECITEGKVPRTNAEEGLNVLRVLTTAQEALDLSINRMAR